jgi:hypothetical protein
VIGVPLVDRAPGAVRNALLSHGWEGVSSSTTAASLEPWAHHFTGLSLEQIEGLLRNAPRFGLDLITGDDWALLSGTRSRLSAFARSWQLPPELAEVAIALGTGLPADAPPHWRVGEDVIDLSHPVVVERLPPGAVEIPVSQVQVFLEGQSLDAGRPGPGVVVTAEDPGNALIAIDAALDRFLAAGYDAERLAVDPAWQPGAPPLGLHRRFGRPLMCTTDDPVIAALALQQGAALFRTAVPDQVRRALDLVAQS